MSIRGITGAREGGASFTERRDDSEQSEILGCGGAMRGEVWGFLMTSKVLLVAVSPTPRTVIPKVPCFPHRSCAESVEASKTKDLADSRVAHRLFIAHVNTGLDQVDKA